MLLEHALTQTERVVVQAERYNVGLVQMAMAEAPVENVERGVAGIADAADQGANVVCLPELFRSPYFCQYEDASIFDLAEPIPGPTTARIAAAAKASGVAVIASLFEKRAPGVYHNTAAVFDADGSMLGLYRKMHIPDDPGYYEKFYFTPGDLGFRTFDTRFGRIGVLVCWDQWYPEAARLTALQGASTLFYPTAIGWHPHEKDTHGRAQHDAWRTVQRSHAIANGVYVAAVNRVGHEKLGGREPGIEFFGRSFVSDPFGEMIAEAGAEPTVLVTEVNLKHLEEVRRGWPFLRDRRIDAYGPITRRLIDQTP